jgi:hypothetical protein
VIITYVGSVAGLSHVPELDDCSHADNVQDYLDDVQIDGHDG